MGTSKRAESRYHWRPPAVQIPRRRAHRGLLRPCPCLSSSVPQKHVSVSVGSNVFKEIRIIEGLLGHWLAHLSVLSFSFGCQQLHNHDPEQAHKLRMKYLSFAKTYFPPRDDIDYQCTSACAAQCTPSHCRPEKQLVAAYRTGCPNGRLDPESSRLVLTQTNRL